MIVRFESIDGRVYYAEVIVEGEDHYLINIDEELCWISKDACEIVI